MPEKKPTHLWTAIEFNRGDTMSLYLQNSICVERLIQHYLKSFLKLLLIDLIEVPIRSAMIFVNRYIITFWVFCIVVLVVDLRYILVNVHKDVVSENSFTKRNSKCLY